MNTIYCTCEDNHFNTKSRGDLAIKCRQDAEIEINHLSRSEKLKLIFHDEIPYFVYNNNEYNKDNKDEKIHSDTITANV